MRRYILLVAACVLASLTQAQINHYGNPMITNFGKEVYNADEQNWDVVQDHRGLMYFANQTGVLEYDGSSWRLIDIRNNSFCKSLAVDAEGTVHVGAVSEFGYLAPDSKGNMTYVSLSVNLPDSIRFGDVMKTFSYGSKTFYYTTNYIFTQENDSLQIFPLPEECGMAYLSGDSLVINNYAGKCLVYRNGNLYNFNNWIKDVYLTGIGETENNSLIITTEASSIYLKTPKGIDYLENDFTESLIKSHGVIYDFIKLTDSNFVVSNVMSDNYGVAIIDKNINPICLINQQSSGLADNNCIKSLQTGNILWTTLNNGIARSEIGSQIHGFGTESGLSGSVLCATEFNGLFYVGTMNGLYVLDKNEQNMPVFNIVQPFSTYDLLSFEVPNSKKKLLIASTGRGIFIINNTKSERISIFGATKMFQPKNHKEQLYLSTTNGFERIIYTNLHTNWETSPIPAAAELIDGVVLDIIDDKDGNIWISSNMQGVFKLNPENDSITEYNAEAGLPSLLQIKFSKIDDKIIFLTTNGAYEFTDAAFVHSTTIGNADANGKYGMYDIKPYGNGFALLRYRNLNTTEVAIAVRTDSNTLNVTETPVFNRLPAAWSDVVYTDAEGTLWVGLSDKLYSYRPDFNIDKNGTPYYEASFNAHIRRVTTATDTIFNGTFVDENGRISTKQHDKTIIPYADNTLTFNFSSTFFECEEQTEYSFILEGADKKWSIWNTHTEDKRYNLREGEYIFKVKARNIYGVESSVSEFAFYIQPPFYRTIVAYIIYLILIVCLVYGIVKWNTRRLLEEKKRLEQKIAEATEEIRGQNEQLEKQKDEIEKQKDEIQSSINYARRIQRALLTPDATIDRIFPDHFLLYKPRNVVSGDYYWFGQFGDNKVSIVADCTGHGVPGGFMSMLGMTNLNYIVGSELQPDQILNKLRDAIITSLRQKEDADEPITYDENGKPIKKDRSQDGMDVAMYVMNEKTMKLSFAGANNPLVLIRDGEVQVIKASKMPVGIYAKLDPFSREDIDIKPGDCLYTFSDGYQDQFGIESGRKFMSKHLRELLLEIHLKPMAEQKEILNTTYEAWRGPADHQTDDVVLMGVRVCGTSPNEPGIDTAPVSSESDSNNQDTTEATTAEPALVAESTSTTAETPASDTEPKTRTTDGTSADSKPANDKSADEQT